MNFNKIRHRKLSDEFGRIFEIIPAYKLVEMNRKELDQVKCYNLVDVWPVSEWNTFDEHWKDALPIYLRIRGW